MNFGKESETKEYKTSTGEIRQALRSISAILNKHQKGELYFGVRDDGEVVGMQIGKETLRDIAAKIKEGIDPRIYPDVKDFKTPDGKRYVKVLFSGEETPYAAEGRVYLRVSDRDEQVDMMTLRKLLMSGSSDVLRQRKATRQDLTFKLLIAELSAHGHAAKSNKAYLGNIGLLTKEGDFNYQAELLSDQARVSIKVSRFAGTDKSFQSQRREFGDQPLFAALEEASQYLSALCEVNVVFPNDSAKRVETPLFDYQAFREAWVNAVVHNNWIDLTPPAVYIYDDRLEVVSNGGLPISLEESEFFAGRSEPVNPSLFRLFADLGIVEQNGHGVSKIVASYGKKAFSIHNDYLEVRIPFAFRPSFAFGTFSPSDLSSKEKDVLSYVFKNKKATLREIAEATGLTLKTVRNAIKRLQENGLLSRKDNKSRGDWQTVID